MLTSVCEPIEHAAHAPAAANIDSIVEVVGSRAVVPGPYDLADGLEKIGRIDVPEVSDAIDNATITCQAADVRLGCFGVEQSNPFGGLALVPTEGAN
jgi:2-keto-3-deoxy-L-rhamnonate aldolase RhmA